MSTLTGIVNIKVDGEVLMSREGAKLTNILGRERQTQTGNTVHGPTSKVVPPRVDCKVSHSQSDLLERIADREDLVVTFICDSGVTYLISPAWLISALDVADGGEQNVAFEGKSCKRVGA